MESQASEPGTACPTGDCQDRIDPITIMMS